MLVRPRVGAARCRNRWKLSVVPELSLRCTGLMAVAGRVMPGLSRAMAGSFHVVIFESKIPARTCGFRVSLSTPSRLWWRWRPVRQRAGYARRRCRRSALSRR